MALRRNLHRRLAPLPLNLADELRRLRRVPPAFEGGHDPLHRIVGNLRRHLDGARSVRIRRDLHLVGQLGRHGLVSLAVEDERPRLVEEPVLIVLVF